MLMMVDMTMSTQKSWLSKLMTSQPSGSSTKFWEVRQLTFLSTDNILLRECITVDEYLMELRHSTSRSLTLSLIRAEGIIIRLFIEQLFIISHANPLSHYWEYSANMHSVLLGVKILKYFPAICRVTIATKMSFSPPPKSTVLVLMWRHIKHYFEAMWEPSNPPHFSFGKAGLHVPASSLSGGQQGRCHTCWWYGGTPLKKFMIPIWLLKAVTSGHWLAFFHVAQVASEVNSAVV